MFVADEAALELPPLPPPPVFIAFESSTAVPSTSSNTGESAIAAPATTNTASTTGTTGHQRAARSNPDISPRLTKTTRRRLHGGPTVVPRLRAAETRGGGRGTRRS